MHAIPLRLNVEMASVEKLNTDAQGQARRRGKCLIFIGLFFPAQAVLTSQHRGASLPVASQGAEMKKFSTFATVAGAAMSMFTASAHADALLDFCVDAKPYFAGATAAESVAGCTNGSQTGFVADKISGSYVEKVLGTGFDGSGNLTFKSVTLFNFTGFSRLEGTDPYGGFQTGLGSAYQMYAVIEAFGIVSGGSSFQANSATLRVFLNDSPSTTPTNLALTSITEIGSGPITNITFTGDTGTPDRLLATASDLAFGSGTTQTSGGTDGFAVGFRDFTLQSPDGTSFFILPRPFHMSLYADGSILDGTLTNVGQVVGLNGSGDARFTVPEPGSLALVGLALFGLGFATRRKQV